MITPLEHLRGRVRPFLRTYLESRGKIITSSGHFLCPNPNHKDDKTPSAHIVPNTNESFWVCFGCGATGDIFTASYDAAQKMAYPGTAKSAK